MISVIDGVNERVLRMLPLKHGKEVQSISFIRDVSCCVNPKYFETKPRSVSVFSENGKVTCPISSTELRHTKRC